MLNHAYNRLSLALLTVLAPMLAVAQSTSTGESVQDLDAVSVTGIRSAIEAAIVTKLTENTIVEAISAEDIGKLPDTSIADSLARLPGLATQRFGGRPQEINIRGFAGDFSTALLNGREQVSFSNNRGVEFDQYPSELMSQVVVHKTTNAQLLGQGLSGTVNMKTVRPLDYDHRAIAFNARGDMNRLDGRRENGNRISAAYIDQFFDKTLGVVIGFAHMDSPGQAREYGGWGFDHGIIGGGNVFRSDVDNERDGLMATVQFRPSQAFETTLDVFLSQFDRTESKWGLQYGLAYGNGSTMDSAEYQNETTVNSRWSNIKPIVIRNDDNHMDDELLSLGWNTRVDIGSQWTATTDLSYSRARREERLLEGYAGIANGGRDSANITYHPRGWYESDFGFDYGDARQFSIFDPDGWGAGEGRAQAGYLKDFLVKDRISSARMDLQRRFAAGWISALRIGANHTERSKSRGSTETTLCTTLDCASRDNIEMPIPMQYVLDTNFGFAGIDRALRLDIPGMLNDGVYIRLGKVHPAINNKNWQVDETISSVYVQADLDGDLGVLNIKGNLGIQMVHANQESEGVATVDGTGLDNAINRKSVSYTHYLPSLNLSVGLPFDHFIRFGASRQMARPRMDQMAANAVYRYDQTRQRWSGGGGNPELKPWLADALDISIEKYFADGAGYVSVAWFSKDLKTYIYNETIPFDFAQLPLAPDMLARYPDTLGEYSQPQNGEGGKINGREIAVSLPLSILWSPLQGFGIVANYSDTRSSIQSNGLGSSEPLPGLSRYISSVTGYYERNGFSVRVSSRHRSPFLGEVQGLGGDREKIMFDRETVTDLQLGYIFQRGRLENLSLLIQVNNLENEPFKANVDGFNERVNRYYEYGRTYLFGVNYRF